MIWINVFDMRQLKIAHSITDRTEDSISKYLGDISQIDLLQQDEEVALARKARNGDTLAMERLIKTNLRFVVSVAKQYQNKGMNLSDLISEGNLGLIKAAHRFDYSKGFKFISFAVFWIRQCIIQAISEQKRLVRLPGNQINDMAKVSKVMTELEQQFGRMPALFEIAEKLGLSEEKIAGIMGNGSVAISVDTPSHQYPEMSFMDTLINQNSLCPVKELFRESLAIDLIRMLNRLPVKQCQILKYWYGIDGYPQLNHNDIAFKVGLTAERVRQLKIKAIGTLGRLCKVNKTEDYLNVH